MSRGKWIMSIAGKVIIIGDPGVGKTSLISRYVDGTFYEEYIQTVGANFLIKEVDLQNILGNNYPSDGDLREKTLDKGLKLYFWDIGGQSDKLIVTEYYFLQAVGALVVFNLVNKESFEHVDFWVSKMRELSGDIPFILIGNKTDLSNERVIDKALIEKKAEDLGVNYYETSAKLNENVNRAFFEISLQIINKFI